VDAQRIAVVCPATARTNWQRQFDLWWLGDERPTQLDIDSYQRVANGCWDGREYDVLILDEAHMLKSPDAQRTKAIYGRYCAGGGLADRCEYVWPLSGTLLPNGNPMEAYPHLRALRPDLIHSAGSPMNKIDFMRRYCNWRMTPYGPQVTGVRDDEALRAMLKQLVLRRTEEEVAKELPEVVWSHETVDDAEAATILRSIEDSPEVSELRMHLDTNQDWHAYESVAMSATRKIIAELKARVVGPVLADELDRRKGKMVVFAHHHAAINRLHSDMVRHHPVQITGETPGAKRQDAIDRFQNDPDCRVFIAQMDAAGTAIELTAAHHVEFVEASWTPSTMHQAVKRCHRRGQINTVFARIWGLAGSIDDLIAGVCARKVSQLNRLDL